ncbi:AI-2E family transporter [Geodermatophilus nigrescens]
MPADAPTPPPAGPPTRGGAAVPPWTIRTAAVCAAVLAVAALVWVVLRVLLELALVSFTVAVALLLTALTAPLAGRLRRAGAPPALAALATLAALVAVLGGVGVLVWSRASAQLPSLAPAVTDGLDQVRGWLVSGPLSLDPVQIEGVRDRLAEVVYDTVPGPLDGARRALDLLVALLLVLFLMFFLLKDGGQMWAWALQRCPARHRARMDGAGRRAWATLSGYARGVTAVALIDAVLIGAALAALGVPLWLSLTLLTFLGAYVPYVGATVSGAVAVLVTLVSEGIGDAVVVVVVVLVVQQLEGNVLHPVIMRRAVHLHPVVTLLAVTSGSLLQGIPGAVVAVPVVAVAHGTVEYLRTSASPAAPGGGPAGDP